MANNEYELYKADEYILRAINNPTKKECETCMFYRSQTCKRYPPTRTDVGIKYPSVRWDDWCGEYKRK